MTDNQLYDAVQAALIPGFVIAILSVPGIAFGGLEFAGHTLAFDSTVTLGGITAMVGSVLAAVLYLIVGLVNDAWSAVTDATTDDVERAVVGGEMGIILSVPLLQPVQDAVTTTTIGALVYVLSALAAVYYVAYTR